MIENILNMQAEKLSSGWMLWILEKTNNTGIYGYIYLTPEHEADVTQGQFSSNS